VEVLSCVVPSGEGDHTIISLFLSLSLLFFASMGLVAATTTATKKAIGTTGEVAVVVVVPLYFDSSSPLAQVPGFSRNGMEGMRRTD